MRMRLKCCLCLLALGIGLSGCDDGKTPVTESTYGEDIPSLKFYMLNDYQDDTREVLAAVNDILARKVGATLEMVFLDETSYREKILMQMAAGESFDLVWVGHLSSMHSLVERGGLMPLDALLEGTPELVGDISESLWQAAASEGQVYAVPCQQLWAISQCMVIPEELVEKYRLKTKEISSLEDVEPFLAALQVGEPEIYPFEGDTELEYFFYDLEDEDYRYVNEFSPGTAILEDGEGGWELVEWSAYADMLYEAAGKVRRWYESGYIRGDAASVLDNSLDLINGKYGVTTEWYRPGLEACLKAEYGREYVCIPFTKPFITNETMTYSMIGIGADSRYPELAIRVIEQIYTNTELYNLLVYGMEEIHYERADETHIRLLPDSGYRSDPWKLGSVYNAYLLEGQTQNLYEVVRQLNETGYRSVLNGFVFDDESVRTEILQINVIQEEYSKIMKSGSADPDEYWSTYKSRMEKAGVEVVYQEMLRQFTAFLEEQQGGEETK